MEIQLQKIIRYLSILFLIGLHLPVYGQTVREITDRINAQSPPFEKPFGNIKSEHTYSEEQERESDNPETKGRFCNLDGVNNFQTAVTFYGDSRLDLVDTPLFGYANLDIYLRTSREEGWNVQNLAQSAAQSNNLLQHLSSCYRPQFKLTQMGAAISAPNPATVETFSASNRVGDFRVMQFPNYVTAKNIVFEIGGNDFLFKIPEFIYLPYMVPIRVENTRLNIRDIIALLRRRDRNVMVDCIINIFFSRDKNIRLRIDLQLLYRLAQ